MTVTLSSTVVEATGGTGTANVTTARECSWTASAGASWIGITAGTGQGDGVVNYSVSPNPTASPRTGQIVINDQHTQIEQQPAPCQFAIDQSSVTMPAAGGTHDVSVSTLSGCAWTAVSDVAWISVGPGATGTASGRVTLQIAANEGSQRVGTIGVAGRSFTVLQSGALDGPPPSTCTYVVAPPSQTVGSAASTASVVVSTGAQCAWTATSQAPWVAIVGGAAGSGNGRVDLQIQANTGDERSAGLIVAGTTVTVTQTAALTTPPPATCSYSINPGSTTVTAAGGSPRVDVTTTAGCSWTAASQAAWITVAAGSSGTGAGSVQLSVAPNAAEATRSGTISIAGYSFTVQQEAAAAPACSYSISPTSQAVSEAGGSLKIVVSSTAGCAWTAGTQSEWIAVVQGASGAGAGEVQLSVAPNPTITARSGAALIAGQTFTVQQAGAGCAYSISPTEESVPAAGGTLAVSVSTQAGCAWTTTANHGWLTVTNGTSGTGPGTVQVTVRASEDSEPRTGTVTVAGQTFTVQQAAATAPCTYTLNPTSASVGEAGGTVAVGLTTGAACAWTVVSGQSWIRVLSSNSGTGPTSTQLAVDANPDRSVRSGTVTLGGQPFSVQQAGNTGSPSCTYSIDPTSTSVPITGGTVSVTVTAGSSCNWSVAPEVDWIRVVGSNSGKGEGTVTLTVGLHVGLTSRTGTVRIAGATFSITQPGLLGATVSDSR